MDYTKIYGNAIVAASLKANEVDLETGENWFPCGGASVKVAANTKFGKFLKDNDLAFKNYPSGLAIYPRLRTQKLSVNEAWAKEFSRVLNENNIRNTVESYWD